jgi:hypothetical protein
MNWRRIRATAGFGERVILVADADRLSAARTVVERGAATLQHCRRTAGAGRRRRWRHVDRLGHAHVGLNNALRRARAAGRLVGGAARQCRARQLGRRRTCTAIDGRRRRCRCIAAAAFRHAHVGLDHALRIAHALRRVKVVAASDDGARRRSARRTGRQRAASRIGGRRRLRVDGRHRRLTRRLRRRKWCRRRQELRRWRRRRHWRRRRCRHRIRTFASDWRHTCNKLSNNNMK